MRPNTPLIHHGLGSQTLNGQWHTISRDLAQDLADGEPDNTLLSVNGFLIRGSGLLDDITLEDVGENIAPVADAGSDIDVLVNEAIVLDGSASSDPDGTITQYRWLMDDQFVGSTASIDYSFPLTGTNTFILEVTDDQGARSIDTIVVNVSENQVLDLTDYSLVFSDEFNGNTLDTSKWDTGLLWGPWLSINEEEQFYVDTLGINSGHVF